MADLLSWAFHSPRRVLVLAVVLVAVLVGAGAAFRAVGSGPASGDGSADRSAQPVALADQGAAAAAAATFTRAWASKPADRSVQQWRQDLHGLITPELERLLADTDPSSLPGGAPSGRTVVRFVSGASAMIEVPLTTGRRVLVTVVLFNGRWLANDVQPLAGNDGDVPGVAPSTPGTSGAKG